jgi:DNA-binding transcriptional MerR regulator
MDDPSVAFTIEELARLLGLKPRTIHFWKQTGLFEGPGAGPGARYDEEHLGTLFLIDQLRSEGTPLAEIRKEITKQSPTDLRRLAEQVKATPKAPPPTAKELIAGWLSKSSSETRPGGASAGSTHSVRASRQVVSSRAPSHERASASGKPEAEACRRAWERVPLADGVELHVRQPSTSAARRLVRELIACAQRVSKE